MRVGHYWVIENHGKYLNYRELSAIHTYEKYTFHDSLFRATIFLDYMDAQRHIKHVDYKIKKLTMFIDED